MSTYTHKHHISMHQLGVKFEHLLHNKGFWAGMIITGVILLMFALVALFASSGNISEPIAIPPYPISY